MVLINIIIIFSFVANYVNYIIGIEVVANLANAKYF